MGEAQPIRIPNQQKTLMPETDGVGTIWFRTTGSVMVITAAILLVAKKRMSVYEQNFE